MKYGLLKTFGFAAIALSLFVVAAFAATLNNPPASCSGQWTNCAGAFANDALRATALATPNLSKSGVWGTYGFSIPSTASINSVIVTADFFASKRSGYLNVRVSGDGGQTFGPSHIIGGNTLENTFSIDVTNDFAWSPEKINNNNIAIKAACFRSGSGNPTCYLDYLPVTVSFTQSDSQPTASASAMPSIGESPLTVDFAGTVTGGDAPITYLWNFNDGTTSTQQNPVHTYTAPGTYNVSFTVTDFDGDSSTVYVLVTVNSPCVRMNPSVSISPFIQEGTSGSTLTYKTNVTNNDLGNCGPSAFVIIPTVPEGWIGNVYNSTYMIYPGSSVIVDFVVTSPENATSAYYNLTNTAINTNATAYNETSAAPYHVI